MIIGMDPSGYNDFETNIFTYGIPTKLNQLEQEKPFFLPISYQPTKVDVLCGRGKSNWNHEGNLMFRNFIKEQVCNYESTQLKGEKTPLIADIVNRIRSMGGKFVKQDEASNWYDIGDILAREKVGHSLRDQVVAFSRQKGKTDEIKRAARNRGKVKGKSLNVHQSDIEVTAEERRSSLASFIRESFARLPSDVDFYPVDGHCDMEPIPLSDEAQATLAASFCLSGDDTAKRASFRLADVPRTRHQLEHTVSLPANIQSQEQASIFHNSLEFREKDGKNDEKLI